MIEGASDGLGLGHEFLRHVDRCRLLLHVVDVSGIEGRDPCEDMDKIDEELVRYSEALSTRPQIVVGNKTDMVADRADLAAFEAKVAEKGRTLVYVSAATGEGLDRLLVETEKALAALPPLAVYESEITEEDRAVTAGASERVTTIRRENDTFFVEGDWLYNLMGQINVDDYESLNFLQRVLRRQGIFDMLREKGIEDGHTVNIYDFEFDYMV